MSFLNPQALYYLLPPLFILFGFLLTQKESQTHFFSDEVMDKLRVGANSLTLKARNALFLFMGFFIVIAIAQPVIKDGVVLVKAKSADIMIALDISDSMLAEDVYPNRLEMTKQKAVTLLKDAPNERIGIMAFAKKSYLVSPLSFDTRAVSFLLTQLDTSSITQKGTDFSSIIDVFALSSENDGEKYLLIFSDGGDSKDFSDEIALAKKHKIVVFVLGVGTEKGAPIKLNDGSFIEQNGKIIVTKLNESISDLATSTGGVYIESTNSDSDVKAMLREIKSIAKSKELKSEEVKKYIPLFQYPLGIALLFLLIATSSIGRKQTLHPKSTSSLTAHVAKVFVIFTFLSLHVDSEAGVLDFMDLREAKKAYEVGEYEKSASLYGNYAQKSKSPNSYFNAGNALYKDKKYKQAQESYEKAVFSDESLKAQNLSNIGNALAKQKELQKAVESYEKSLEIMEDKETKENLETVKKLLEQQKKEEEKKDENSKDGDKKDKEDEKDSDDSKDGDKNSDEKDKSKKEQDSSKSKDSKDKKPSDEDMNSKNEKESEAKDDASKDEKKEEEKKEQLEKLDKGDDNKTAGSQGQPQKVSQDKMSDAEEQKWLNQLNLEKNTYMYQLGEQKPNKDTSDEKPW